MNFQDLHELLRLELLRRIELGLVTGTRLAQQAGFQQAHISNFLNRKRALSLEGLDRMLAAQNLSIDQILPVDLQAGIANATDLRADIQTDPLELIPLVSSSSAMDEAQIDPAAVIETIHVPTSRLRDTRARPSPKRAHWRRFLAIRADAQHSASMEPVIAAGAIVVLDRHYNSLAPYQPHQRTLYAVRCGAALVLRYVEFDDSRLILRPLSNAFPVQLLAIGPNQTAADYIVGRVCLIVSEL